MMIQVPMDTARGKYYVASGEVGDFLVVGSNPCLRLVTKVRDMDDGNPTNSERGDYTGTCTWSVRDLTCASSVMAWIRKVFCWWLMIE